MINIRMLPAQQGDCIVIEYGPNNYDTSMIIIDSGKGKECTSKLRRIIQKRVEEDRKSVNLLILTHYDFDHIGGFNNLIRTDTISRESIDEMWFNFGKRLSEEVKSKEIFTIEVSDTSIGTNVNHGVELYKVLCEKGINVRAFVSAGMDFYYNGAKIKILSPSIQQLQNLIDRGGEKITIDFSNLQTANSVVGKDFNLSIEEASKQSYSEKNVSVENKSSIAFIFQYEGKNLLFLGDAVSSQIELELIKLGYSEKFPIEIDACKIMHHGSEHNTSGSLIRLIRCKNYLISGKWGSQRPTKICLSRIVVNSKEPVNFFCNYPIGKIFSDEEIKKYEITISNIGERGILF